MKECGCPECVGRCCHFDGRVLVLTDRARSPHGFAGYRVALLHEPLSCVGHASCCGAYAIDYGRGDQWLGDFPQDHEALAAFYAAELELLAVNFG